MLRQLWSDEDATTTLEYALLLLLIVMSGFVAWVCLPGVMRPLGRTISPLWKVSGRRIGGSGKGRMAAQSSSKPMSPVIHRSLVWKAADRCMSRHGNADAPHGPGNKFSLEGAKKMSETLSQLQRSHNKKELATEVLKLRAQVRVEDGQDLDETLHLRRFTDAVDPVEREKHGPEL